ncbi:hypothetical protein N7574_07260 [Acinetobacter ursingii]|uniref:DUF3885 domain-containing protein n=2 Tax=Acinetobacter TaxID=469 RepID=N9D936_9GAMM|nr:MULTISPECIES: hypothetical protein [Acinetobacter]ENV79159.1 hypothetical protein F942_01941 [Acinetobacter ursingii ANC 3649]MCU4480788.1 hypothetical protein [Acinetobacter ursingii]MCU4505117.1 hypothetical protein [Acinetobacter ursingii]MDG9949120.1 hypothetical protein [Acinetobacter ursingii]MEC6126620.1 hypothetical protein [Acinetobacter ursingii]
MSHSFQSQWDTVFPNKVPISQYLVQYFTKSWFRIHSLPESKRYADTTEEYELLLNRHNEIITDCFGENTSIFIVSGHYFSLSNMNQAYDPIFNLQYKFHLEKEINLTQTNPEDYDDEEDLFFRPCSIEVNWQPNIHNDLLTRIADDKVKAFMISFEQNIIVAPYDGGIDFIIFEDMKRNALRDKYKNWLSPRADGL